MWMRQTVPLLMAWCDYTHAVCVFKVLSRLDSLYVSVGVTGAILTQSNPVNISFGVGAV